MEGVHLADSGEVVMFDAKVILAFVESVELFVADVANETRLFEVGVDVMVELVLTAH